MGDVKGTEENLTVSNLRERFPDAAFSTRSFCNETTLLVGSGDLIRFCRYLREDPGLLYDFLSDLTAVDRFGDHPRFEVVYHLYSLQYKSADPAQDTGR
ncbi:MAG: NADH-quinone oxidoreductase subunit C [Candidatus Methylomirabilis sp.]|nr:NADH-quinone oxidoreductase subunit C [Candidatus Methylomirabilis sp.]